MAIDVVQLLLTDKFVGSKRLVIFSQKFIVVSGIPRLLAEGCLKCSSPEVPENFGTSFSDTGTTEKLLTLKK